jgi:hypothetical protein
MISVVSIFSTNFTPAQASITVAAKLQSEGTIIQQPSINININQNAILSSNALQLGTQITYAELVNFANSPQQQALLKATNIKIVRIFDSNIPLCLRWDENTHSGNFNWEVVDPIIQAIFDCRAQPLVNLLSGMANQNLPPGMQVNSTSGLPYLVDAAAYAAAVAEHFNSKGYQINYYEISNEIQFYLFQYGPWNWNPNSITRTGYFLSVFNAAGSAIKSINPNAKLSFDFITYKQVLDYWLTNGGADLGSLNLHKYDLNKASEATTDQVFFDLVSTQYFEKWPLGQSLLESQAEYNAARGKILPIIVSESNLDGETDDPRTMQIAGAVWLATLLKTEMIQGISYSNYFSWSGSLDYSASVGQYGMFMIDCDHNQPQYPYYVYKMIGPNLSAGDAILLSESTSSTIQSIVWNHQGKTMILLISQTTSNVDISLRGIEGELRYQKLDSTMLGIQSGSYNTNQKLTLQGYSVILLNTV